MEYLVALQELRIILLLTRLPLCVIIVLVALHESELPKPTLKGKGEKMNDSDKKGSGYVHMGEAIANIGVYSKDCIWCMEGDSLPKSNYCSEVCKTKHELYLAKEQVLKLEDKLDYLVEKLCPRCGVYPMADSLGLDICNSCAMEDTFGIDGEYSRVVTCSECGNDSLPGARLCEKCITVMRRFNGDFSYGLTTLQKYAESSQNPSILHNRECAYGCETPPVTGGRICIDCFTHEKKDGEPALDFSL